MTRPSHKLNYEVASAVSQGQRENQQDAVIADFPLGSTLGFAVLADGMGGHSSGEIASKIVLTEVYSELKLQSGNAEHFAKNARDILHGAVLAANDCVKGHVELNPETRGMGTTLLAPVFLENNLFWISVGDSPLYLFREGTLRQLNEDHSMAPHFDALVQQGKMAAEEGLNHPDRQCLTSVLIGKQIAKIDCPAEPFELRDGDILIVSSDGLQYLGNDKICDVMRQNYFENCSTIAKVLLSKISELDDPHQDNVSFSVVRVQFDDASVVAFPTKFAFRGTKESETPAAKPDKSSSQSATPNTNLLILQAAANKSVI